MGKLLRVLVIIILVLSAVSLLFAYKLFGKQELLTKRSSLLEEQVVKLAKTIEAADAADAAAPDVKRDVSEVADRVIDNPDKEAVLEGYPFKLEQQNLPTLDYGSNDKRLQLRSYYVLDAATGKYVPDPLDQKPMTKGPGSMQELLDQSFERAKAQQASLNKTRAELTKMREKATTFVEEINKLKTDGRTTKVELKNTKEQVVTLTGEKEALEGRVTKLTSEKKELAAELADNKNQVERLTEEKVTLTEELGAAQKLVKELKERMKGTPGGTPVDGGGTAVTALSAGDKGKIIEANDDLKFVIIDFSNDAILEMLGPERQNAMPQLEMNVRRTGRQSAAGEFVTRIKLRQIVRGKNLVVADILSDWQQVPVEKGDVVFF